MAQPTGHQNIMFPAAQGMPSSGAPALIPNGQPPQWNRPPPMPHAMKTRPPPTGSNIAPSVSNGTPTPPNYSHPGSISSHSSRDPSPIPPNRHGENFSSSSPNLIMSNSQQPSHPQSPTPPSLQRGSPGINQIHHSQFSGPGMPPPSLVNQNAGQSKSTSVLPPPAQRSGVAMTSNVPPSYSQDTISRNTTPQNIPSPFVNQTPQEQRLGTSQLPHSSLGQTNASSQKNVGDVAPNSVSNGPPVPRTNAQVFATMRLQGLQTMPRRPPPMVGDNPRPPTNMSFSQPGMPQSSGGGDFTQPGIPPNSTGMLPSISKPSMPPGQSQSLPPTSKPSMPPGQSQSPLPPTSASHSHPGLSPVNSSQTQSGSPSKSTGYVQPEMPPTNAAYSLPSRSHPQPGMPPTSSVYSQAGMPPTSSGYSQQGMPSMPPTSGGYSQPGMPLPGGYSQPGMTPTSGYSRPGMPSSGVYPQSGMPPTVSTYSQAVTPASGTYPQSGMPPTSGYSQPGMPPTSGYSQPGMPPTSGYSQPGMPPTSGYSQPGMPPTSGYSKPGMPPTSGYSQPGMPPTSGYSQSGMPPTSGYSQSGMPPTSGYTQSGMPSISGYSQPGMPSTSGSYSQPTMPNQFQGPPQSQQDSSHLGKRYPQQQVYQQPRSPASGEPLVSQMGSLSVTDTGFNKLWGRESIDLLQNRNVLPVDKIEPPKVRLHQEFLDSVNCNPDIFRCTLTKIPETNSLLQKSRLPLGILIHPFKDLNCVATDTSTASNMDEDRDEDEAPKSHEVISCNNMKKHLPVIQCSTIVRCRSCRTYINPFVYFVDHKRWKCNLCFRVNELPEEFQYDPVSKTYGDPTRRPEVKSSTIEFIAPSEYMLRPPQPAVYLFLLDVSRLGVDCGYLRLFCDILLEELDKLPGDGRTQIGFITYDSYIHFYNLAEGLSQPQQMIVVDTDDVFLPCPDNLLANLSESRELVKDLLNQIPTKFLNSHDTNSALGAALQAAYKLMAPTGGRVTVFQTCLPNHGPGMLTVREDPSQRAGKEAPHLNPATDFYKRLALDCSGQQIAVDLFLINSQYSDLATLSGISRFSGGCIYHFPLFKASNTILADSLERSFRRYLSRKIGFEAVMRIRCSRGLAIHTFHGNFFVRSTDLLSLPNVNPDAGFGMQVSIEESLSDVQNVCFQAALLYTSSKGERRIRVHTLCLPVAANLTDILYSADQQCIVGLLAKMAVDRSHQSSLSDARDAFINVAIDVLSAYKLVQSSSGSSSLLAPTNLQLLPLYILALLKYIAFRTGQSTRLDDRLFAMCQMKSLPLTNLIQAIYPDMYPVHYLSDKSIGEIEVEGVMVPQPPRLHLSAEKLDSHGAFIMDAGDYMMMYVGHNISSEFCSSVLGVPAFSHIPEEMFELPENESPESERLRSFVNHLQSEKPYHTMFQVIRDDSHYRAKFIERLIEDRSEAALSYYEFLQHLKSNVK